MMWIVCRVLLFIRFIHYTYIPMFAFWELVMFNEIIFQCVYIACPYQKAVIFDEATGRYKVKLDSSDVSDEQTRSVKSGNLMEIKIRASDFDHHASLSREYSPVVVFKMCLNT